MTLKSVFTMCSAQRGVKKWPRPLYCVIVTIAIFILPALVPIRANAQGMKLLTPTTGWFARFGRLYWTTNSGSHWSNITPVPPGVVRGGVSIRSVFFRNTQEGWVVISHPQTVVPLTLKALRTRKTLYDIAHTVDGGQTWSFLPLTYPKLSEDAEAGLVGPADIYFFDSLHGWLVMAFDGNSYPGGMLVTDDGGRSWKWVNSPGTVGTLLFTSTQDGWLAGGPGGLQLFTTHDGCKTWKQVNLVPPPQFHVSPQAVYEGPPMFLDAQHAFVAARYDGLRGAPSRLVVFSTADAGKTWKASKVLKDSWEGALPVDLADSVLIVPSGASAKAMHVAEARLSGGVVSHVVVSGESVLGMTFADAQHGLALNAGRLLYTSDGGVTWDNVTPWTVLKPLSRSGIPRVTRPNAQSRSPVPRPPSP